MNEILEQWPIELLFNHANELNNLAEVVHIPVHIPVLIALAESHPVPVNNEHPVNKAAGG
jgi:hypothetical protein